jgi:hypothetical protein
LGGIFLAKSAFKKVLVSVQFNFLFVIRVAYARVTAGFITVLYNFNLV